MNERAILQAARAAALASPCLLAEETARTGFAWMPWNGYSLVLTINAGYE
jgi:hypothetical protein